MCSLNKIIRAISLTSAAAKNFFNRSHSPRRFQPSKPKLCHRKTALAKIKVNLGWPSCLDRPASEALLIGLAVSLSFSSKVGRPSRRQLKAYGSTLPYKMPINPVHCGLLNSGKVLIVVRSEWGNQPSQAAVWDPAERNNHRADFAMGRVLQRYGVPARRSISDCGWKEARLRRPPRDCV